MDRALIKTIGDGFAPPDAVQCWSNRPLLYRVTKRALDLLMALPLLILTLPLQVAIALLIPMRLDCRILARTIVRLVRGDDAL